MDGGPPSIQRHGLAVSSLSCSPCFPDTHRPRYGGKEVGYVEHRFEPDGAHTCALVRVAGLKRLDISDFAEAAYGLKL